MTVEEWLGKENALGKDIWEKKYRYKGELFDEWVERVSGGDDYVKDLILKKKFLPGGRVIANIRTDSPAGYSNCYSEGFVEDDYGDIMDTAVRIGKTFKSQGGQGLSLSKLRPKGTAIGNQYESDGIIPFMKIFNEVTAGTSQGGSRKGALLMSLDAWHKEAMNFITLKSEQNIVEKANLSLEIDDEFMECVKRYFETGEVITVHKKQNYSGHEVEWDVTPIDVFKALVHNNYDWGDPGCLFVNRLRNYNIMEFCDDYQIETTNPSLRAGTKVLTTNGAVPIESLVGTEFDTYNIDGERCKAKCFLSGKNKQLYKITLDNRHEIFCTPEHKWPVWNAETNQFEKKLTTDLSAGMWLPMNIHNDRLSDGTEGTYEDGFFFGFWYGDGCLTIRSDTGRYQYGFTFGKEKKDVGILDKIKSKLEKITGKKINYSTRNRGCEDWYEISCADHSLYEYFMDYGVDTKDDFPKELLGNLSEEFRRGFVDGLISTDGSVFDNKQKSICFTTSRENIANEFSDLMWWYGIRNALLKEERDIDFGNGNKTYVRYDVKIGQRSSKRFSKLFTLSHQAKQGRLDSISSAKWKNNCCENKIKIVAIEETSIHEDVYDIHVYDDTHTFPINYCITGNCGEQPLPKHSCCNLGSLNLSEFVKLPYTENAYFDYDAFEFAVFTAVKYLDGVIDLNADRHPLKEQREMSLKYRNVGLGVFGYASMLMKLGLEYGDVDAIKFTDELFNDMFRTAVIASSQLAEELGTFPMYSEKVWDSTIIRNHFTEDEIEALKKSGLRNCSLLSIAPCGSISTMLGESSSSEPEFALSYTRRTVGMTDNEDHYYKVYCKAAREYLELYPNKGLPDYFVAAHDINPRDRIETQATIQDHIDTAISSTVNVKEDFTEEEMQEVYLLAWEYGLKGITIFRDNCKRVGILTTGDAKNNDGNSEGSLAKVTKETIIPRGFVKKVGDNAIGLERHLTTGCGSLHCNAFFDPKTGELLETYLSKGSAGGCLSSLTGLSRMISLAARGGISVDAIVDQLRSTVTCPSYAVRRATKGDTSHGDCCPSAVGHAITDMHDEIMRMIRERKDSEVQSEEVKDKYLWTERNSDEKPKNPCPNCGEELSFEGGCVVCKNCGYSKCD